MVTRVHEPSTSRAAAPCSCFGQGIGSWKTRLKSGARRSPASWKPVQTQTRVPSSGRASAVCSGWGRGGRRSGAPTSNRHVGTPLESLWSPGNDVFLRNGKFFWHFLGSGLGCGDREEMWPETFPFPENWSETLTVRLCALSARLDVLAKTRDLLIGEIAGVKCYMLGQWPWFCVG